MENNYILIFDEGKCVIYYKNRGNKIVTIVLMSKNKLFTLKFGGQGATPANVSIENKVRLWHLRYGHLNHSSLKLFTPHQIVHGIPKVDECKNVCEGCALGKHHRSSFPRGQEWRASYPLQLVHFDIFGPMQIKSMGMNSYFLTFIDDFSRMCWLYFLKIKYQSFDYFMQFKNNVKNQSGFYVKCLRIDRGEYMSNEFTKFCRDCRIKRQLTTSFTPK